MRRFAACRFLERVEKRDSPVVEKASYQPDLPKPSPTFPWPTVNHQPSSLRLTTRSSYFMNHRLVQGQSQNFQVDCVYNLLPDTCDVTQLDWLRITNCSCHRGVRAVSLRILALAQSLAQSSIVRASRMMKLEGTIDGFDSVRMVKGYRVGTGANSYGTRMLREQVVHPLCPLLQLQGLYLWHAADPGQPRTRNLSQGREE